MNRLVVGCGYLGRRVARKWVNSGDRVYAITRNHDRKKEFESAGITAIVADITQPDSLCQLAKSIPRLDTVLFAVGMDRSQYSSISSVYVDGLQHTLDSISPATKQIIYISSTGVYGDFGGRWINETSPTLPTREGGRACLAAERLIAASPFARRTTILRFGGIYGPDRVPTRQSIESQDWKALSNDRFLNLIHVDDGARVVEIISNQASTGDTFIVSDGNPPSRREYYQFVASHFGCAHVTPEKSDQLPNNTRSRTNKRVSNRRLLERYDIQFEYPDYQSGLKQALP